MTQSPIGTMQSAIVPKRSIPDLLALLHQRPDLCADTVAVLDIACGTGSQLVADHRALPEPEWWASTCSRACCSRPSTKASDIGWVRGDGARLPFADHAFDLVTNQFAFHHVQ